MKKPGIHHITLFLVVLFVFCGCTIKPQPIAYGTDGCRFCSMTIVDTQHAAQLVTKKGKTFKFDAVECMVNHLKEFKKKEVALFLINDYNRPGENIDATKAIFLMSKNIPSPMGEFLTAFNSSEEAEKAMTVYGGELLSWDQVVKRLNRKDDQ